MAGIALTIALTIPHLIHGLQPGPVYSATTATEVYAYEPATAAGSLVFSGPDSGRVRVQVVEVSGVPEPPSDTPKPPASRGCGGFGAEIAMLAAIAVRSRTPKPR